MLIEARHLLERVLQMDASGTRHAWAWRDLARVRNWLRLPAKEVEAAFDHAIGLLPAEPRFKEDCGSSGNGRRDAGLGEATPVGEPGAFGANRARHRHAHEGRPISDGCWVPGCLATSTGGAAAKKRLAEYCASGESPPSDRSCAMLALRRAGDAQSPELAEAVTAC